MKQISPRPYIRALSIFTLTALPILAQSPLVETTRKMSDDMTGPIAKGGILIASIITAFKVAQSDMQGHSKIGGLLAAGSIALGANKFIDWYF